MFHSRYDIIWLKNIVFSLHVVSFLKQKQFKFYFMEEMFAKEYTQYNLFLFIRVKQLLGYDVGYDHSP